MSETIEREWNKDQSRAFDLIMEAGKLMLENGGEIFRAQQTMEIMASSLQLENFSVYVLTNGIFASVAGQQAAEVRHIPYNGTNLGRVEAVNSLSRGLAAGELTLPQAEQRIKEIRAIPDAAFATDLLCGAMGSAGFALLFGANVASVPVAAAAGGLEILLCRVFRHKNGNRIFRDIIASAAGTALVLLCRAIWPIVDANTAIIGALMVLTPGVALVMGVRDFVNADYLSGTIRLINAVLVACSLAFGVGLTYTLARALLGVRL